MDDELIFERQQSDPYYDINQAGRYIQTDYQGIRRTVPFDAAFAHAIDCMIHIEDGKLPNVQENLFLAVYIKYLKTGLAGTPPPAP